MNISTWRMEVYFEGDKVPEDYLGLSWDAIVKKTGAPTQHSSLNGVQHLSFCANSTRTAGNFVGSPRAASPTALSQVRGEPELVRHDLHALVHVLEESHAELGPQLRHLGRSSLPTPSWLCSGIYRNQCHGYLDATVRSRIINVPRSPFSWGNNAFLEAPEFSGSSADETIHPLWLYDVDSPGTQKRTCKSPRILLQRPG